MGRSLRGGTPCHGEQLLPPWRRGGGERPPVLSSSCSQDLAKDFGSQEGLWMKPIFNKSY